MSEFLTIGEPISLFASEDDDKSLTDAMNFHKYLAGAEVNVAVGVARLGHSTQYITAIGADPFGDFIKEQLKINNIGTDYIASNPDYWTAFQLKQKVTKGDPGIFYFRKGSAAAHFDKQALEAIDFSDVKLVHLSGIFPAISDQASEAFQRFIDLIHKYNVPTTFDPNLRPQLWATQEKMVTAINNFAKQADIVLPGINEGKILVGTENPEEIADFYLNQSDRTHTAIVKLGEEGAYIKTKDGLSETVPGYKVEKVVDTVGAGDGFAVGVITSLLDGKTIVEAARRGNAIGSLGVQAPGDNDGYPTPIELKKYMGKND